MLSAWPRRPVIEPLEAALLEMGVQLGEAGDRRDRHQEVAPGVADQALDLALVVALAGPAEAVEEQVVRLQLGEGARPLAPAVAEDAGHRQLGVVVEDRPRHAAQEGEGRVVAVEEGLDPLGRVGLDEAGIRVRQVEAEEVDLLRDTPPITATASPKSTWAWPGGWASGTNTSACRCRRSRT